jgi:CheY-like chemotaxis protein
VPKPSRKRSVSDSSPRRRAASNVSRKADADGGRAAKILVVDDEIHQRTVIYHSLRAAGHSVSEAADGEEALKKLKRTKFDLVVLDIMMPRMSGYEVLERIREMPGRADTPVVIVTAKHDPGGVMREVAAGADEHVAKPFLPSELEEVVGRVLRKDRRHGHTSETLKRSAHLYGDVGELRRGARKND